MASCAAESSRHIRTSWSIAAVRVIDDLGVTVHQTGVDRLELAARLAASKTLRMYDALFVSLADELDLPLLTSDAKLARAG